VDAYRCNQPEVESIPLNSGDSRNCQDGEVADTPAPPSLVADCDSCFALCCVLLPFQAASGFGIDKPGGTPCPNLADDDRCRIHATLREDGWPGSVWVLPAVVAASWAASIASRLRVVNFSAPNWLIRLLAGLVWDVSWAVWQDHCGPRQAQPARS
jgi:hypothetical protein